LHAPRRSRLLPGGRPQPVRALRRPGSLGAKGHPQRSQLGEVLERPDHRGVRGRHLARRRVCGAMMEPAMVHDPASSISPLAGNAVETTIQRDAGVTPTPVISWAILAYNRGRTAHLADGIVVTPSHNPPEDAGFKYDPPNGGPADVDVTGWVQDRANELLRA